MRLKQDETECNECIEDLGDNCVFVHGEAIILGTQVETDRFLEETADISPIPVEKPVTKKPNRLKDLVSACMRSKRFRGLLADFNLRF